MRSSYHAAAAAAATAAVTVTAILISHHHRRSSGRQRTDKSDSKEKMSSGESLENGCVSAMDSGSRGSNSGARFPWEPAATMATASGSEDGEVVGEGEHMPGSNGEPQPPTPRNETKRTPPHHRPQKDQLDFLASMTYARSGLWQPNCPCCI